jgi:hypothetical protein
LRDGLDIVRKAFGKAGGVEASLGQQVLEDVLGLLATAKLTVASVLAGYIDVGADSFECVAVHPRAGVRWSM